MTTRNIASREQKSLHRGVADPKVSARLRDLLPLGAVISRTDDYVQVFMLDNDYTLPDHFKDHLCTIIFVSHVLGAAQEAQEKYGVPASVLIAKSIYDCGWGCEPMKGSGNHFGDTTQARRRSRSYSDHETKLDFHREARRITRHPKYSALASPFIDCHCEYIAALCRAGIIHCPRDSGDDERGNALYAIDLMCHIVNYQLWHCDESKCGDASGQQARREQAFFNNFEANFQAWRATGKQQSETIGTVPPMPLPSEPRPFLVTH
jgi:hypothetical protein